MRMIRGYRLVLGMALGLAVGMAALTVAVDDASAQEIGISVRGQCGLALLPLPGSCNNTSGGDARAAGGNGGNGGNGGDGGWITTVHDVGNAEADASNLVIVHDITTGDATASDVNVNAEGATRPVVVSVAGSAIDTGVDVFAPGGNSQAGTTGGNGITSDSSGGAGGDGGDGGNAHANGGDGGDVLGIINIDLGLTP